MALQDSDKIGFHNEIMFAEEIWHVCMICIFCDKSLGFLQM